MRADYQVNGGSWQEWYDWSLVNGPFPRDFTGTTGNTYCFRFQAVDNALNIEPLDAVKPEHCTTLYDLALSGFVGSNRAQPVNGLQRMITPDPLKIFSMDSSGFYTDFLVLPTTIITPDAAAGWQPDRSPLQPAAINSFLVDWKHPGFGSLPSTRFETFMDIQQDIFLPPADDQIVNGQFEVGVNGCVISGTTRTAFPYSGSSALELSNQIRLSQSITFTPGSLGMNSVVDGSGNLHIVTADNGRIRYWRCDNLGQCAIPVTLAESPNATSPDIEINNSGSLFVVWGELPGTMDEHIQFSQNLTGSVWSQPVTILPGGRPRIFLSQDTNLIVTAEPLMMGALLAATRMGNGEWVTYNFTQQYPGPSEPFLDQMVSPTGKFYAAFRFQCPPDWLYTETSCLAVHSWTPGVGWWPWDYPAPSIFTDINKIETVRLTPHVDGWGSEYAWLTAVRRTSPITREVNTLQVFPFGGFNDMRTDLLPSSANTFDVQLEFSTKDYTNSGLLRIGPEVYWIYDLQQAPQKVTEADGATWIGMQIDHGLVYGWLKPGQDKSEITFCWVSPRDCELRYPADQRRSGIRRNPLVQS